MSKRRYLIAANWKMHKTLTEARTLAREVRRGLTWGLKAEVALAPPFTALATVAEELADSDIRLAAQDTFWERQGAFTRAISLLIKNVRGYLRKRQLQPHIVKNYFLGKHVWCAACYENS
jgi:triosephosphate isomerase